MLKTQMQRILERLLTLVTSQVFGKQRLWPKTHAYNKTCAADARNATNSGNLGSVWKTTTFRRNWWLKQHKCVLTAVTREVFGRQAWRRSNGSIKNTAYLLCYSYLRDGSINRPCIWHIIPTEVLAGPFVWPFLLRRTLREHRGDRRPSRLGRGDSLKIEYKWNETICIRKTNEGNSYTGILNDVIQINSTRRVFAKYLQ